MTLARGHITISNIKDGKDGKDGAPALTLVLTPAQLVFDADTDGIVTPDSLSANTATVQIAKGSTMVTPSTATVKGVGCTATCTAGTIRVTAINKDGDSSLPAGYIDVTATYDGSTFTSRLYWSVNINRVVAKIEKKATTIEQSVKSINKKMENGELTTKEMEAIVQLAEGKVRIFVQGLKDAGIDVESGQIVATADNFKVKNSSGTETFLINKDGKIMAPLANIGDWKIEDGKIVSALREENKSRIVMNAKEGRIDIFSKDKNMFKTGKYIFLDSQKTELELGFTEAIKVLGIPQLAITASTKITPDGIEVSGRGIRSQRTPKNILAGLYTDIDSNLERRGSSDDSEEIVGFVAGVYGKAENRGDAPYYGGFFNKLKVCGLYKKTRVLFPSEERVQLDEEDTQVILMTSSGNDVYINLPRNPYVGQTIEVINAGRGWGKVYAVDGSQIYWNTPDDYTNVREHRHDSFTFAGGILYNGDHQEWWIDSSIGECGRT